MTLILLRKSDPVNFLSSRFNETNFWRVISKIVIKSAGTAGKLLRFTLAKFLFGLKIFSFKKLYVKKKKDNLLLFYCPFVVDNKVRVKENAAQAAYKL